MEDLSRIPWRYNRTWHRHHSGNRTFEYCFQQIKNGRLETQPKEMSYLPTKSSLPRTSCVRRRNRNWSKQDRGSIKLATTEVHQRTPQFLRFLFLLSTVHPKFLNYSQTSSCLDWEKQSIPLEWWGRTCFPKPKENLGIVTHFGLSKCRWRIHSGHWCRLMLPIMESGECCPRSRMGLRGS